MAKFKIVKKQDNAVSTNASFKLKPKHAQKITIYRNMLISSIVLNVLLGILLYG